MGGAQNGQRFPAASGLRPFRSELPAEHEARTTSRVRFGKYAREFFAEAWGDEQSFDLCSPLPVMRGRLMRADCRIVVVDLVQSKQIRIIDGTDYIEPQVARLFPGLGRVERHQLKEVVNTLRLYVETDNDHVHRLERVSAAQRVAGNRVTMLLGLRQLRLVRCRIDRALGDGADSRSEIRAISQGVQLDAEYGADAETACRDSLLGDGRSAGH